MLDGITLRLSLDDRGFRAGIRASQDSVNKLGKTTLKGLTAGTKRAADSFKLLGNQAAKAKGSIGKLGGLQGTLEKVGKWSDLIDKSAAAAGFAGLGISAIQKYRAKKLGKGGMPAIPGTKDAEKQSKLFASSEKWGNFAKVAGTVSAAAGVTELGSKIGLFALGSKKATAVAEKLGVSLGKIEPGAQKGNRGVGLLNKSLGVFKGAAGLAMTGVTALAAGAAAAGAGFVALATSGLKMGSDLEEAKAQFEVFTGSAAKADAIILELNKRADITPFATKDYIEGGTALMSAAEGSKDKLMELLKTSEMLTVLNPEQGLTGAALAIKNALAGDFVSLQDRFNIAPSTIQKYKAMGLSGQELIRAVLKSMNVTEKSVAKLGTTFKGRASTVMSFIDNIRKQLSAGLFAFISERMGGMIAWIDANGQKVLDIATGLGTMIGQTVSDLASKGAGLWSQFQFYTTALGNFFTGLPERIGAAFQDGTLMSTLSEFMGSLINLYWSYLRFLGSQIWNVILNGVPTLVAIVSKLALDGIKDFVGKIPGATTTLKAMGVDLEGISSTLGDVSSGGFSVMKDNFTSNFDNFKKDGMAALSVAGESGSKFVNNLGWNDATAKAAANPASMPSLLQKAQQMGQSQREAKEKEAAAINWGQGNKGPQRQQITPAMAQAIENNNAKAGMRVGRNLAAHKKHAEAQQKSLNVNVGVTSMDGNINVLST